MSRSRRATWPAAIGALLLAAICAPGAGWGNGQEEDEGHFQEPVILTVGKPHRGAVGGFGESFYAFRATAPSHTVAVTGHPPVRWRLLSGSKFRVGLLVWCRPTPSKKKETTTQCRVEGLKTGTFYYLNVYSFNPHHSNYVIEITITAP